MNVQHMENPAAKPLPDGWRWVKLKDIGPLTDGDWILNSDYASSGVRLLQVGDVGVGEFIGKSSRFVTLKRAEELNCTFLQSGDVLISRMPDPPGRACLLPDLGCPSITAVDVSIWRPKKEVADREFVTYYLNSQEWFSRVMKEASGATRPRISRSNLENLEMPLPPLAEQKRIAGILKEQMAAVERARASAEAQLQAAEHLPAAYLRAVFTNGDSKSWPRERLGKHVTKVGSGITPLGGQATYLQSGIPLIRSQNVHMNRFERDGLAFISTEQDAEMSGSRVEKGDVLLNITGASIGRVCVVPDELCPANVNQHVSIIRGDGSFHPAFLSFFISMPDFQKHILDSQAGATRQALTKALIEDFEISFPPFADQRRIAAQLSSQMASAERLRQTLTEQLDAINHLPAALLREAFSGKL